MKINNYWGDLTDISAFKNHCSRGEGHDAQAGDSTSTEQKPTVSPLGIQTEACFSTG